MKQTVHIVSLGCPKNLIDSEVMAAVLVKDGFHITPSPEDADIILVNTCAFVLPAKEESIDEIFRMARMKEEGQCTYLVVTGCLPQRYGTILEREIPEVDLFTGIDDIPEIAHLINNLTTKKPGSTRSSIDKPTFLMTAAHTRLISTPPYSAYIKIAEGCSNRCSYCVIPEVRGSYRSREVDDVLEEAEILAASGVKEIILTAQETTAYGKDLAEKPSLSALMRKMTSIDGIRWIRLLYTYPVNITEELLRVIYEEEKICNYIDIPVQHIDDDILRSMNRRGDSLSIRNIIDRTRGMVPGVAIRTSLIVGYPGETEEKFEQLLDFVKATRFDHLGVFQYSEEEGTKAAELPNKIPEQEKELRRNIIMEEQSIISYEINQSLIGSIREVMIEGPSDLPEFTQVGRIKRQSPDIDGVTYVKGHRKKPGDIIRAVITAAEAYDLYAEAVPPAGDTE